MRSIRSSVLPLLAGLAAALLGLGPGVGAARAALPGPAALMRAGADSIGGAVTVTNAPAPGQVTSLRMRLDGARAELALVGVNAATNLPPAASVAEALELRVALNLLVRSYESHLEELEGIEATQRRQEDLDRAVRSWNGFPDPPPWSLLVVDQLWDSIQSLEGTVTAGESTRAIVRRLGEEARALLQDSDERLRQIGETLERAVQPTEQARQTWLRTLEQARNRAAAANVAALEARQRRVELDLAEQRQRLAFVRRQHAIISQQVRFSLEDLQKILQSLELARLQLQEERRAADVDLNARQRALAEARDRLRDVLAAAPANATGVVASSPAASAPAGTNTVPLPRLEEIVQIRSIEAETAALHLRTLGLLTDAIMAEEALWERRFATFGTDDLALLRDAYRRLARLEGLLEVGRPYFLQQIDVVGRQIAEQQDRLRNQPVAAGESPSARDLLDSYRLRDEFLHRALSRFERTGRLVQRWKEALDRQRVALPFGSRVRDLFGEVSSFSVKLWTFELFAVADTIVVDGQPITGRRAITVGKLILAVLILLVGTWVARMLARWGEGLAIRRLKIEPNQAGLIRRWIMVVLVLGLVVFSLVSVRIPLTIFAFAGGALAIGVGFGTQNLLKNFISGIIILFERPFRVGDILDVAGRTGVVTGVGIRSSVLQLWDGTETLIPNSTLLENNLTNWTYTSRQVRFAIGVGVAYGSDTRVVSQLLGEVAERHGLVLKEPKPVVLFKDFGDSSLLFELRYWLDVGASNSAQVASDLRHMIAGTFADHRIDIAFPQRDVRLDTTRPLQIAVQRPPREPASPPGPTPPPTTSGGA